MLRRSCAWSQLSQILETVKEGILSCEMRKEQTSEGGRDLVMFHTHQSSSTAVYHLRQTRHTIVCISIRINLLRSLFALGLELDILLSSVCRHYVTPYIFQCLHTFVRNSKQF